MNELGARGSGVDVVVWSREKFRAAFSAFMEKPIPGGHTEKIQSGLLLSGAAVLARRVSFNSPANETSYGQYVAVGAGLSGLVFRSVRSAGREIRRGRDGSGLGQIGVGGGAALSPGLAGRIALPGRRFLTRNPKRTAEDSAPKLQPAANEALDRAVAFVAGAATVSIEASDRMACSALTCHLACARRTRHRESADNALADHKSTR
jgi:hypothetical protein